MALSADINLSGAVIAAQTNTIQSGFIAASGAILVEFSTPEETIAAVKNGEADAVLADSSFLTPIAESDPDLVLLAKTELIGGGVGMGLRESDDDLRVKFDAAIALMKVNGTLNALITKHKIGDLF